MARALPLLKAYQTSQLPFDGGFIVSAFFLENSIYTILEVTAFRNVKDIYVTPEGLTFKTDGNRTHVMVEPPTYSQRYTEPVHREAALAMPYRFDECTILTGKRQERIIIPKEPIMLYSSFTILNGSGDNFSYIFYLSEDVYIALRKFISDTLYSDCGINKDNSKTASDTVMDTVKKFSIWKK